MARESIIIYRVGKEPFTAFVRRCRFDEWNAIQSKLWRLFMVASGKMTVGGIVFGLLVLLAMGFGDGLIRAQSPAANGGTAKARNYEFRSLTHGIDYQYSEIYRINTATGATMYRDWSKKDNKNVFKPVTDSTDPGPGDYDLILLNLDKGGYAAYRIDRASGRCWLATNDNVWTTIEAAK